MSFDFNKYVKLWPFTQFVGLELIAGGLVAQRYHPVAGGVLAIAAWAGSSFAFVHILRTEGFKSLFNIRRLLQLAGYVAVIGGMVATGFPETERGTLLAFVGTGFTMAGLMYDAIYP